MAWQDTFQPASFKGVEFEILTVSRSGQRSIAVNEYPYTAGADLDDLGLRPRHVKVKAIVYGEDYHLQLAQLIDALDSDGVGELVHPIHGSMQALAEAWEDEHDPGLAGGAIVSISFVEHTTRVPVFTSASSAATVEAITEATEEVREVVDAALVRYVEDLLPELPTDFSLPRFSILTDVFDQAKGALSGLLDMTALRTVLSDLDPLLYPLAYAADLFSVVDRALQGLPFGLRNLLFDSDSGAKAVAGSGMADFKVAARLLDPAVVTLVPATAAPSRAMVADAAVVQAHARAHAACAIAECAAIILAAEMETPLLGSAEIEVIANTTRAGIQVAIDGARDALDGEGRGRTSIALRSAAYAVQQAALAVVNQRPPLVRRASPISGPVRLLAHQLYGDASRAVEIYRLNTLGRHVLVERGEMLHVYTS